MKLLSVAFLLTQLVLEIRGQTWYEFAGHCYTILHVKSDFETCRSTCLEYGAYVVELEEDLELDFVRTLIDGRSEQYWVGTDYNNVTQKFHWARDGQEPLSSSWLPDEPNHSGQCVRLATENQVSSSEDRTFKLGDHYCTSSFKVICEKNADMLEAVHYRELVTSANNRCPMVTYPSRSKLNCARNCAKNRLCVGFQYNDNSQNCTPYKFDVTCATPLVSPLSLYVMEFSRC